tara:strand:+ start:495 stop:635 length:141 start_codon:yes stop_codon:yes gene_type:complete
MILKGLEQAGYGALDYILFAGGLILGSVMLGPVADTIENFIANLRK